jgi:threonine synthase
MKLWNKAINGFPPETRNGACMTGIFPAPEGAACLVAQMKLLESGWIKQEDKVVLFNTGESK